MTKDEIKAKLDDAGIEYDARLGIDKLAALLKANTQTAGVMCIVQRDYWPTDNEMDRVRKGTIVEVTADEAMDGMESGLLARVK